MGTDSALAQQSVSAIQSALHIISALQLTAFKYPDQYYGFDGRSFDYIIIGGGTAGCVLANRLVENNETTVLLIEAGGDPPLESDIPALRIYMKTSKGSWNYTTEDRGLFQEAHKPTYDEMSLGRVLGGCSSTNYLLYSSGSKHDYDNWAKIVNDTIWSWDNVLPYLKKSQRLEDPLLIRTDGDFYGQDGYLGLTVQRSAGTVSSVPYFKAFTEAGHDIVPSVNGNISLGYTNPIFTISNNTRQNTAFSYLEPIAKNKNLYVLKNTLVKEIQFDANKNAVGIIAFTCKKYIAIQAKREIIVSAGVVNTAKLLMLSGIGPREQLKKHGIRVISDLPVGEGLQDNLGVTLIYNMTKLVVPYRPFNPFEYTATTIVGYVNLNKSHDYPDYQSVNYVNFAKGIMSICSFNFYFKDFICNNLVKTDVNSQMIYTVVQKQRFKSRGKIVLKSKDFKDDPLIYAGYYSVKEDLEDHARIVQDFVRVEESETFNELGGKFKDPKLPKCGKYNKNDLEYWKCYIQYMMTSYRQYSSTCPMGTVVDSRLRVYGVKRLRVVDASVMPNPTAGGTLGSTIMIGEKAADMIKEDNLIT